MQNYLLKIGKLNVWKLFTEDPHLKYTKLSTEDSKVEIHSIGLLKNLEVSTEDIQIDCNVTTFIWKLQYVSQSGEP